MLKRVWLQQSEEYPFTGQGPLSPFDESIDRLFSYELQHSIDVSKERLHDLLIYLSKDADADITFNNIPCKVSELLATRSQLYKTTPMDSSFDLREIQKSPLRTRVVS